MAIVPRNWVRLASQGASATFTGECLLYAININKATASSLVTVKDYLGQTIAVVDGNSVGQKLYGDARLARGASFSMSGGDGDATIVYG